MSQIHNNITLSIVLKVFNVSAIKIQNVIKGELNDKFIKIKSYRFVEKILRYYR